MTIIQYFNEHILTFLYKRYKFTHRSFLLFLRCGTISGGRFRCFFAATCLRVQSYKLYTKPPNNFGKKL